MALVPLVLATIAFGHAFRASETDRADARLAEAERVALERVTSAAGEAEHAARTLAADPDVQLALAHHDAAALAALGYRRGALTVLVRPAGETTVLRPNTLVRSVSVVNGGTTLGRVEAGVDLSRPLAMVGRQANAELVLATGGVVGAGRLEGWQASGPVGAPAGARFKGDGYRVLRERVTPDVQLLAIVPESAIGATVRHRQLVTLGAAALTLAAIAFGALFLGQRRRARKTRRGERSPVALVGDVVAAAHDPRALLPVILETAVHAMDAAGGKVVWDGERIATIGETTGTARERLVFSLDEEDEQGGGQRRIVLYPRRGGFTDSDREVASALIAQGRIALENARLHSVVRRQAVTDELTDLANRRRFMEVLHQEVARTGRFGTSLALALCDLDHFKQINDRYGHQAGDDVLRAAAAVIRDRVRETDLPARVGGEEFAIILPGTDLSGACALAEQLRRDLSVLVGEPADDWIVTASFGVAVLHDGETAEVLIGAADRALYRAKAEGRNRVCAAEAETSAA